MNFLPFFTVILLLLLPIIWCTTLDARILTVVEGGPDLPVTFNTWCEGRAFADVGVFAHLIIPPLFSAAT